MRRSSPPRQYHQFLGHPRTGRPDAAHQLSPEFLAGNNTYKESMMRYKNIS